MNKKFVFAFLIAFNLSACASLRSVSLTSIPADRKKQVEARASRIIIFGLNFDNDYVERLVDDLKYQCPSGKVAGVLTKDEVIDYFLMIVHKRQVTAKGFCVDQDKT